MGGLLHCTCRSEARVLLPQPGAWSRRVQSGPQPHSTMQICSPPPRAGSEPFSGRLLGDMGENMLQLRRRLYLLFFFFIFTCQSPQRAGDTGRRGVAWRGASRGESALHRPRCPLGWGPWWQRRRSSGSRDFWTREPTSRAVRISDLWPYTVIQFHYFFSRHNLRTSLILWNKVGADRKRICRKNKFFIWVQINSSTRSPQRQKCLLL